MTGYSREEVIGHTSIELGLVDAEARARILEAIRTQGAVRDVEIQVHTRSNEAVDVLVSAEEIELNGQRCAITIQYDITQLKRAEREVRRLNNDLERRQTALEAVNKELEAFTYSVAHDLRAPLRAIDGFSRLLLEEHAPHLDSEAVRYLDTVRRNAQRMGALIDDLLAFSRLGRQPVKKQSVLAGDLVRRVFADLSGETEGRQVELSVGELPPCRADPALLQQVFANLLSNALKFSKKRDVARIEVGCQRPDGAGAPVYFVKDNGAGFDMQYADKLFGVFQRLHPAQEYEGTGIGLAIVQRIIHRHGGRIWAEAEIDRGAAFYFTLGENHD
jgi:light-regulated signal transduction histidine kinase (bacteriophytochrome)